MKKMMSIMTVAALVSVFAVGCGGKTESDKSGSEAKSESAAKKDDDKPTPVSFKGDAVCGSCGAEAAADHKCAEDGATCKCGFHHDSALCCTGLNHDDTNGKLLCVHCGGAAEEGHKCPDGEKCADCGQLKGSTFCCLKRDHKH